MTSIAYEVTRAARLLARTPWSTSGVLVTLALGTGFNSAVLALAYGILLRPLPYAEPSRLVIIQHAVVPSELAEWRKRLRTVDAVAGFANGDHTFRGLGEPRIVRAAFVTSGFFSVLGAPALAGRALDANTGPRAIVLSERLVRAASRPAPQAIDAPINIVEGAFTVIGVMPSSVAVPDENVDAWLPAETAPAIPVMGRDVRRFTLVARLKRGVSVETVRDDAMRVRGEMAALEGARPTNDPVPVVHLESQLFEAATPVLLALTIAAFLVLLIACGNVASLLLSRSIGRDRETAILLALGAPATRVVHAQFIEALLLAIGGSALGIGMAFALVRLLRTGAATLLPRLDAVSIDLPVLAGTLAVALLVAVACTVGPALHSLKRGLSAVVRPTGAGHSRQFARLAAALVVVQIALSVVVLVAGGLLARTVTRLLAVDVGIDPGQTLTLKLTLGERPVLKPGERQVFVDDLLRHVRALPDVHHAGLGSALPPQRAGVNMSMRVVDDGRDETQTFALVAVTDQYFAAVGARRRSGALLTSSDAAAHIVVSRSAATHLFRDRDATGRQINPIPGSDGKRPTIAGVVDDVKYKGLDAPVAGAMYVPWSSFSLGTMYLVVRTTGDPMALAPRVRDIIQRLDRNQPVADVQTLENAVSASIADRRLHALLASSFALLALAVSIVGLAAALGRRVTDRRRELAIRSVLGSTTVDTVRLVMRHGATLTIVGVVLGLALAPLAARGLSARLFGVDAYDSVTYVAVAVGTTLVALLACLIPTYRAVTVDPATLLRGE